MKTSNKLENGLFIFRRDLRIVDNTALITLNEICKNIYTIFIFTPEQVGDVNKYKSNNSVQFMIESLEELASEINKRGGHLYTFYGKNERIIEDCIKSFQIDVVAFNIDITPYALKRDKDIIKLCEKMDVFYQCEHDYYLHPIGSIKNKSGQPYQKFTPYYETAQKIKVNKPRGNIKISFQRKSSVSIPNKIELNTALNKFTKYNSNLLVKGGRDFALKLLSKSKNINNYKATHNDVNKKTTELSASIKFGCVSVREVYYSLHSKREILRQIYWRDFYANILFEFPRVLGHSLKENYDKIKWHTNNGWFEKWCKGETGFPIVDAGMRQMNQTGYMHNRARLIVASFLVKTLLIDWQKGEKYFATKLTDYDVASNNGNWQWCAGTGADSQPYFRIFNPWRQGETYDPECVYIKQWIPQLKNIPPKDIHNWETKYKEYKEVDYPKPIVDFDEQREKALKMYKTVF